jgi:hypothetical protein
VGTSAAAPRSQRQAAHTSMRHSATLLQSPAPHQHKACRVDGRSGVQRGARAWRGRATVRGGLAPAPIASQGCRARLVAASPHTPPTRPTRPRAAARAAASPSQPKKAPQGAHESAGPMMVACLRQGKARGVRVGGRRFARPATAATAHPRPLAKWSPPSPLAHRAARATSPRPAPPGRPPVEQVVADGSSAAFAAPRSGKQGGAIWSVIFSAFVCRQPHGHWPDERAPRAASRAARRRAAAAAAPPRRFVPPRTARPAIGHKQQHADPCAMRGPSGAHARALWRGGNAREASRPLAGVSRP